MISLSFYWSLCVSQFFDVKRKDFWQMFIHHIATIVLMSLSWVCNLPRIGSLVLVVHDCADIFLEVVLFCFVAVLFLSCFVSQAAKMAKYSGYQKVCDTIFAIFTVLWIVTRLGVFPFWIIYKYCFFLFFVIINLNLFKIHDFSPQRGGKFFFFFLLSIKGWRARSSCSFVIRLFLSARRWKLRKEFPCSRPTTFSTDFCVCS